jgi:uncharacterized phage protein (TIGR02218 family)
MTGPLIKRGPLRSVTGVEVDTLDITIGLNSEVEVANMPLAQFARLGGFDGARVAVDRYFAASWMSQACGSIPLFSGRVADQDIEGTAIRMAVKSDLELLGIKMPRNVYQGQCIHTVYDAGCGLVAAAFTVAGAVTGGSTAASINCNLAQAAGYFNLGTIEFSNGPNAGVIRTVKVHTSGVIVPVAPFPYAPATGNVFQVKPGCDGREVTCNGTFTNTANIRFYPYIPAPELSY